MNFKTDISKLLLLGNKTIHIIFEDKIIDFNPPNIELLFSHDFSQMKSFLKIDPKSISVKDLNFIVENEYELFLVLLKELNNSHIIENFNKIFPNLIFENGMFKYQDIPITYKEYMILIDFLEVSCGEKELDSLFAKEIKEDTKLSKLAELEKKMQEGNEKLKKLKEEKKGGSNSITIDQIVIAIIYEFPGLKIEDIFKMNLYSILELWKYISKIVDNQIQIVAAGNGLIKDFTYFIN